MTALYEIAAEYRQALAVLADIDAPPEAVADTVESLQGDLHDKLRACIAYSLELDILADGAAQAAKRMADRAKTLSTRTATLRAYVLQHMQDTGTAEVQTDEWAAKVAKTPASVQISDGAELPAEFLRVKTTTEPDKTALKAALAGGREVAGVSLVTGYRLAIK